jgi:DNA (cytosine-5)-methyltransferase 1
MSNRLSVSYEIAEEILSPHQFGVPQHRKRIYVVGALKKSGGLNGWKIRVPSNVVTDVNNVLETGNNFSYQPVRDDTRLQLEVWEEFVFNLRNHEIPRFPIWTMEFGANYPYDSLPPVKLSPKQLGRYKGAFGKPIDNLPIEQVLPRYARVESEFPNWKVSYIRRNREFYEKHKGWLKSWITKIQDWDLSHQKFEWNAGGELPTLKDKVIQFRPSGIRVKKRDTAPALVLSKTQVPIIWDERMKIFRYITTKEAARLQSLESLTKLPETDAVAYKALGNAVNAEVVRKIVKDLLNNTISN